MLSRLSLRGGQSLKKIVVNFQPIAAVTTSTASNSSAPENVHPDASKYPPEFPIPGPKRDFVNFPRLSPRDAPPPVRMGFLPASWFDAFYPKTGYTGPIMLLVSFNIFLFSKELVVLDHNMVHLFGSVVAVMLIQNKFGDKIRAVYDKLVEQQLEEIDGAQEKEKQDLRDEITGLEGKKSIKDGIAELAKARTEIVQLQLEMSYRERIMEAYKSVKNALDCQAELENVERRATQRILNEYVIQNVMKSITPELQSSVMKTCISDLNALAAKA